CQRRSRNPLFPLDYIPSPWARTQSSSSSSLRQPLACWLFLNSSSLSGLQILARSRKSKRCREGRLHPVFLPLSGYPPSRHAEASGFGIESVRPVPLEPPTRTLEAATRP